MEKELIKLTAAEVGSLWSKYMTDSLSKCVLMHFLAKTQDPEIRPVVETALAVAEEGVRSVKEIFQGEGIAMPTAFGKEDVNTSAPPLFSDSYYLFYTKHMAQIGMTAYATSLALMARPDIMDFFETALRSTMMLSRSTMQALLKKGLFVRPPNIPYPTKSVFAESPDFIGSLVGEKRPLHAIEISHLHTNVKNNALGRAMTLAFGQVAKDQEVREYCLRGSEIARKHIGVLRKQLEDSDLPSPVSWDAEVLTSTVSPFSDKLLLNHVSALSVAGIASYGAAIAASTRPDITADYIRLNAEALQYGEDGINMLIERGWFEEPPQAADRKALVLR